MIQAKGKEASDHMYLERGDKTQWLQMLLEFSEEDAGGVEATQEGDVQPC